MRRPDFPSFRQQLLRAGISPRHVRRTLAEIRDHYDDLVDDSVVDGLDRVEAERLAASKLGDLSDIAAAMKNRPELKSWAFRFPRIALMVYPLACIAVLPAVPVVAGVAHAPQLARWMTSLLVAGLVTATMLLVLQLAILFA